ncbi:hypothetical protein FKM82_005641 [Ascaphus truei]
MMLGCRKRNITFASSIITNACFSIVSLNGISFRATFAVILSCNNPCTSNTNLSDPLITWVLKRNKGVRFVSSKHLNMIVKIVSSFMRLVTLSPVSVRDRCGSYSRKAL